MAKKPIRKDSCEKGGEESPFNAGSKARPARPAVSSGQDCCGEESSGSRLFLLVPKPVQLRWCDSATVSPEIELSAA
jgi:hypothetical protein